MAKLKEEYQNRIIGELEQKLGTTNRMLVPRLQKIVVNMGFGIVSKDEQKGIVDDLTAITGQRPLLCKAKKSISNFKLREGMVIGAKVTLRGDRMWDGMDVTFVTTSKDNKAAKELLVALGMPFAGRN